ncbi:MAG: class I SAM-dependent methyltransferase [Clostridia bacterium]|nr:class I SAM-dependent methyltransferase [Clostridia bacterium]
MYNEFASVYDLFIDVDYKKIAAFYSEVFRKLDISPELVLDLGCGTGTLTGELKNMGYDAFGVDMSENMLAIAKEKHPDILFINQDMRELDLYGTCGAIVSSLDCLNYISDKSDLEHIFRLCANFLDDGGAFVFDVSSEYKLSNAIGNETFVMENDTCFGVWENEYKPPYLNMCLNFFVKSGEIYTRFEEQQTQRAWKRHELTSAAEGAGFEVCGVYNGFSFAPPDDTAEREVYVLLKEKHE